MTDDAVLVSILETARGELLDLTARNRLLNTSRSKSRSSRLEIVDELSEQVFRRLVCDHKPMSFFPRADADDRDSTDWENEDGDVVRLLQPEEDEDLDQEGVAARHRDDKLQTSITSEALQKKLLKLFYDARTYEEEQGVNILYMALGFLKWYEDDRSDRERHAPLLLIPVKLDRSSASSKFKLHYSEDDLATNLSLQARVKADFGIELPDLPETDELSPNDYFAAVAKAVENQPRWEVLPDDMVLWFFSFSKFLMYRDLEPDKWPEERGLGANALINSLLRDGFASDPPLCGDDDPIDDLIDPINTIHILDADSSQALAIEEVKRGRNLVIQGPPGTGKSQTIANLIAAAVQSGKSVLFVAEKMAALEVVERRLKQVGLGDMCLELHSNKANKRAVLQQLERTLALGQPKVEDVREHCEQLSRSRDQLNRYLDLIHSGLEPSNLTPYQIVGELVRLRAVSTRPPSFQLRDPEGWTRDEFNTRRNLLRDLVDHVSEIGRPSGHPWRGSRLEVVIPIDVDRIRDQVSSLIARIERLVASNEHLAEILGVPAPKTALDSSRMAVLAQHLDQAPAMDRPNIGDPAWANQRQQIDDLLEAGRQFQECGRRLEGVVVDSGWDVDMSAARQGLAAHGRSWFRFFIRSYRDAMATLRGICVNDPPKQFQERLAIVDTLLGGQKAKAAVVADAASALGSRAFGSRWRGEASDWDQLHEISAWEKKCREDKVDGTFREVLAKLPDGVKLSSSVRRVAKDLKPGVDELKQLFGSLEMDVATAFGAQDPIRVSLVELLERLQTWRESMEELSKWVHYSTRRRKLESKGMSELTDELHGGETGPEEAVARFEMAFYEALIKEAFKAHPELASFNGASHEKLLRKFRQLDADRIDIARHEVARSHYDRLPTAGSDVGEVGVVRKEIQKKRRHIPIRKLLAQAGRAVQAIKPVFMMSPISVAQYLEPGTIDFDLLMIDEASQVQPVDALGAIARARQIVVVGDSRQLPPTRFFSRMLGEDSLDEDEPDELNAGDMESILGLCCAQNVPQRMLRWHYRSRHHSLIAVSNHEFYDNRLCVIPSPGEPGQGQGLTFHFVSDGTFDRGGSATNRVEARTVAKAVMAHARHSPDKSLGVGTFSVAQRDAILDELELLRRNDPSLESFFATQSAEPFFVKNLENIQGDERDVIFISVGYGKTTEGYMAMNFGPLSSDGGERRLNVLITRARDCCAVFASIRSDDIDINRARSRGAQALKVFLKYAEHGLLDTGTARGEQHDSEFERQVSKALAAHGYQTHPQVGVAGFFIDLAVVDPEQPGRYLLGIECDGANYHSSRSARDRDRLRQAVLENRGWAIHRIWSTDWFQRPEEELKKTIAAIEEARIQWAGHRAETNRGAVVAPVDRTEIVRQAVIDEPSAVGNGIAVGDYVVSSFKIPWSQDIHELAPGDLAQVVSKIIRIESPIHRDEIARRVTQLWGQQRTGRRIKEAVEQAIISASQNPDIVSDGPFYMSSRRDEIVIRNRRDVESSNLRKPEMIPPMEIRKAIVAIAEVHLGVSPSEAIVEAGRLFGFKSTSSQLRAVFEREIQAMLDDGLLEERNSKLYAGGNAARQTSR